MSDYTNWLSKLNFVFVNFNLIFVFMTYNYSCIRTNFIYKCAAAKTTFFTRIVIKLIKFYIYCFVSNLNKYYFYYYTSLNCSANIFCSLKPTSLNSFKYNFPDKSII